MDFLCIAHRGASGYEPENTLLAVRKALEFGADGVEVDVYNVEGELMVIHDDTLERTTNGRGTVAGKSAAYLRSLDAGKGERIPFLREVVDAVAGRAFLNVELKGPDTALLAKDLLAGKDGVLVSSFDHRELARAAHCGIPVGVLWTRPPRGWEKIVSGLQADSVNIALHSVRLPFVEKAHALGMKVFVYTVNNPADIERMRGMGVDGVFTNFPDRV